MKTLPQAKTTDIIVQDAGKELLVYNLKTNVIYKLNETLTTVYYSCNGAATFDDLKRKHKFTDELIYLSLDELKKQNLLKADYNSPFVGMNRREVIRKVGLASMIALPMIASIVAPAAAKAVSLPACCTPALPPACLNSGSFQAGCFATNADCFAAGQANTSRCCGGTNSTNYDNGTRCCTVNCNTV